MNGRSHDGRTDWVYPVPESDVMVDVGVVEYRIKNNMRSRVYCISVGVVKLVGVRTRVR